MEIKLRYDEEQNTTTENKDRRLDLSKVREKQKSTITVSLILPETYTFYRAVLCYAIAKLRRRYT